MSGSADLLLWECEVVNIVVEVICILLCFSLREALIFSTNSLLLCDG
jgi:hypothetical protein